MLWRKRKQSDFNAEVEAHLEHESQRFKEQGLSEEDARMAARRAFGNVTQAEERFYEFGRCLWWDHLVQDVRFGLRTLRKNPGFAAVAVLTLALGIGANTAIFSAVNAVMLRPLPYRDPSRLAWITDIWHKEKDNAFVPSPDYTNWSAQARSFTEIAAYDGGFEANLTGAGEPQRIPVVSVTANFFHLLGITPVLGRTFLPQEVLPDGPSVAILSYDLWQHRFGLDPNILGKSITVDSESVTVVGVMPPGFRFPDQNVKPQCYFPFQLPTQVDWYAKGLADTFVVGRLRPRVTPEQAQAELADINSRDFVEVSPPFVRMGRATVRVQVVNLQTKLVGNVRPALLVLMAAVGFVLLIACVNVANLQLVRNTMRQQEFAVRAAVGAGRSRLIRQLLTEGAVLALLGGALGLLVAAGGVHLLRRFGPENVAQLGHLSFDRSVLLFTLGATSIIAILFGMLPALAASGQDFQLALKYAGLRPAGTPGRQRLRMLLATAELALALVLLVGSGLLLRSFVLLSNVDPGFDPHNVLTARLQLPEAKYSTPKQQWTFYEQVLESVRALPGIESAGAADVLPLNGFTGAAGIRFEGQPSPPPGAAPSAPDTTVSPDYFRVMRIPLVAGRFFDHHDGTHNDFPIIVNQSFAWRFFSHEDPIDKRVRVGAPDWPWRTIVGVVGDIKQRGVSQPSEAEMYRPYTSPPGDPVVSHESSFATTIVIRSQNNPLMLASAFREQVAKLDPNLPIFDIATMDQRLANSLVAPRFNAGLLGVFAVLALFLAVVGIYGVISHSASQRTHEIGIRMALGALPANVLRLVMGEALAITALGIGLGLAACLWLMRYLASLLFGIPPTDPLTIAAVSLVIGLVALQASYLPARRATKVDPIAALRCE
ncbi:MAG TPA: ABC transporter permease [Terriglobales bacterium]|nr:ABC transporter permease [Terriglobales bacterium]